ncbi:MAG: hypothetical protein LW817_02600 [Candidatus Caenarcaniphilales bacterium]|jgi:6-phosphogluconolactonase/glucosamine-6-phosphate isomerase/deaminase|nr:hypothetical protein [Candidatus Caenarcaniphilales bacterium]
MQEPTKIIKSFQTSKELEDTIIALLIEEFKKPGLILLPTGNTFEERIYKEVNKYFSLQNHELLNSQTQERQKVDSDLRISHLDELLDASRNTFSTQLINSLPSVIEQLSEDFFAINIDEIEAYDRFIFRAGGPRLIFLGLGADPSIAHVAFIGEEYINSSTAIVTLSEATAKMHNCTQALTVGTDIFKSNNLERIIIVAKGNGKAQSIEAGFKDPDTGLGYLLKHHRSKITIYADFQALSELD